MLVGDEIDSGQDRVRKTPLPTVAQLAVERRTCTNPARQSASRRESLCRKRREPSPNPPDAPANAPASPVPPAAARARRTSVRSVNCPPRFRHPCGPRRSRAMGLRCSNSPTRFAEGRGLPRDLGLAAKLFDKAAQAGLAPAQFHLGNLHEKGVGVSRDLALARAWYSGAAAGATPARCTISPSSSPRGPTESPDYATAVRWFGRPPSMACRTASTISASSSPAGSARGRTCPVLQMVSRLRPRGDDDAAQKRDEVAARLAGAELAAAKALVAGWRARAVNPDANEIAPRAQGWSAARRTSPRIGVDARAVTPFLHRDSNPSEPATQLSFTP